MKHLDLGSYTHELIYLESVSPGKHFKNSIRPLPFLSSCEAPKKAKNVTLAKECVHNLTLEVTWSGFHLAIPLSLGMSGKKYFYVCLRVCVYILYHQNPITNNTPSSG